MDYERWPVDELIVELSWILSRWRAATSIYDALKPIYDGGFAPYAFFSATSEIYQDCLVESEAIWAAIAKKGGVVPERLRNEFEQRFGSAWNGSNEYAGCQEGLSA